MAEFELEAAEKLLGKGKGPKGKGGSASSSRDGPDVDFDVLDPLATREATLERAFHVGAGIEPETEHPLAPVVPLPPPLPPPVGPPPEPVVTLDNEVHACWVASLRTIFKTFEFVSLSNSKPCEYMILSLVSTQTTVPSATTLSSSSSDGDRRVMLQWVVWDVPETFVCRKTRVDEHGKLVFMPAGRSTDLGEAMRNGSARCLLANTDVRMIRRSGMFRPAVPWQALIYSKLYSLCDVGCRYECDFDEDDAAPKLCAVCRSSVPPDTASDVGGAGSSK